MVRNILGRKAKASIVALVILLSVMPAGFLMAVLPVAAEQTGENGSSGGSGSYHVYGYVYDPDGDTITYTLQYSKKKNFPGPQTTEITGISISEYTIPAGEMQDGETWYWKVQVVDSNGASSAYSAPWSFTITVAKRLSNTNHLSPSKETSNPIKAEFLQTQFTDQVIVRGEYRHFSLPGDSGSVVVDDENKVCALLFAGSQTEWFSVGNDIKNVEEALGIRFV